MNFFVQITLPLLFGLLAGSGLNSLRRLKYLRSSKIFEYAQSFLFLAAQLYLIITMNYGTIGGLLVPLTILLLLSFTAMADTKQMRFARYGALIFYTAYIFYWALEKYLLAPSLLPSLSSLVPAFGLAAPDLQKLGIIGISYIGFKLIHFFVDLRGGAIKKVEPLEFLSWLFFFPSIVAGPMMRYQDWQDQRAAPQTNLSSLVTGAQRFLFGLFVKIVIADSIHDLTIAKIGDGALSEASFISLAAAAALYSIYLYLDFSAYSNMAIGAGLFFGIKLPENFNNPFAARNLSDFWNRWHISLSTILRDYLFYPLSLTVKRTKWFKGKLKLSAMIPPVITFFLAGIWHGAGLNFVLYGLIHGIGLGTLAILKARKKSSHPFLVWWSNSKTGHALSALVNFAYVTFSFVFFALPWDSLKILFSRIF